jgi:hypothetical protein
LTSDELEAVADLERKPSDELSHEVTTSHPELSDPVAPKRLTPFLQYMQRKREKIAAKAREKTRKRVQRHRTALAPKKAKKAPSSLPSVKVLLKKLQKAVAERAPTDRFLQTLIGREREFVRFRIIMLGGDAPDSDLAKRYTSYTGMAINRHQALRMRRVVEKLLAPGGVWNR